MKEETILNMIMGAGAGLVASVSYLFKVVMNQNDKQIKMAQELGEIKGNQEGISSLSQKVLDTVHVAILESKLEVKIEEKPTTKGK